MAQGQYRLTDATPIGAFRLADAQPDTTPPYQPRNILEEGRRSVATGRRDDTPDDQAAWAERNKAPLAAWFETKLRPLLEQVAHPTSISDIAQLVIPDAMGVTATMKGGPLPETLRETGELVKRGYNAVRNVSIRRPVAAVLDVGAAALDNPIAGIIQPRLPYAGQVMRRTAEVVRGTPAETGAVSVAGYPRGSVSTVAPPQLGTPVGSTPAPAAPVAAPVRDLNAVPAARASAPPAAPVRAAAGAFNPSTALAEVKATFTALGETPLRAEASNAMEYIRRGESAEDAVAHVLRLRPTPVRSAPVPATPVPAAPAAAAAVTKPSWTAEEVAFGQRLMARGKTEQEAIDAILAQRALLQVPGTQSNAAVRAAQDLRNAQGATKTPSAATAATRRR